jgi:hypothetical protein
MSQGLILGAYALEPPRDALIGREDEWYELLAGINGGAGIEVPYRNGLHPDGPSRLAELVPDGWKVVITMLPSTMAALRDWRDYGLASQHADGRAAALADLARVRDDIRRVNDATGSATVVAVQLHSAPRGGSAASFAESVRALAAEDWSGAELMVEHCDAWRPDRQVNKGFLPLEDEVTAVSTGADVGHSINWGRSTIEGRSPELAREHIARLTASGTISCVFFSGASAVGGALGEPWSDVHNPLDVVDPSSLLTTTEIARTVDAFSGVAPKLIGVKVADPARAERFSARIEPLRATVAAVRDALA